MRVITSADLFYFVDVEEVLHEMQDTGPGTNFYPFPSKIFFLLFLLIHSPRPLVSRLCLTLFHITRSYVHSVFFFAGRIKPSFHLVCSSIQHGNPEPTCCQIICASRNSFSFQGELLTASYQITFVFIFNFLYISKSLQMGYHFTAFRWNQ